MLFYQMKTEVYREKSKIIFIDIMTLSQILQHFNLSPAGIYLNS